MMRENKVIWHVWHEVNHQKNEWDEAEEMKQENNSRQDGKAPHSLQM